MAFSLGIINENLRSDLNDIRLIRIAFAHSPTRVDFANKGVLQTLDGLNTLQYLAEEARIDLRTIAPLTYDAARFAVAISLICGALSLGEPF